MSLLHASSRLEGEGRPEGRGTGANGSVASGFNEWRLRRGRSQEAPVRVRALARRALRPSFFGSVNRVSAENAERAHIARRWTKRARSLSGLGVVQSRPAIKRTGNWGGSDLLADFE